jgi:hypothetical protein
MPFSSSSSTTITEKSRKKQSKRLNYATGVFFLNTLLGLLGVLISGISLYFLFRFCVAVIVLDEKAKRILLGDSLFEWMDSIKWSDADPILFAMALYLAFRVVQFILSTANFESNTHIVYRNLQLAKRSIQT